MTAYRTAPAPDDRPYVNPYLERSLLEYYRRHRRRDTKLLAVCLLAVMIAVAYVLVAKPVEGWFCKPTAFLGLPGAFGFLFSAWSFFGHRPYLLERIRTGIPIRRVRIGAHAIHVPVRGLLRVIGGESSIHVKDVPTIYVEFSDGRAQSLPSLGDPKQLIRIEELLRVQMDKAHSRLGVHGLR